MGVVMIRLAILPVLMEPSKFPKPMANAPLMVAALKASSGISFICIQAMAITIFIFPVGEDPGLKSLASARAAPASNNLRAGGKDNRRKKAAVGNNVQIPFHPEFLIRLISSSRRVSR